MPEPLSIIIDHRIRLLTSGLSKATVTELKEAFEHRNPQYFKLQNLGIPVWNEPRVYKTWHETPDRWLSVPRGGLQRIRDVLDDYELDRTIVDRRTTGQSALVDAMPDHKVELYEYQVMMAAEGIAKENCILKAPTGGGKTTVGMALAARLKVPTLVMVPSRALFDQWIVRAQKELGFKRREVGVIRGSTMRLGVLTIAMQKTLAARVSDINLCKFFGCLIVDEVQLAAARTVIQAIDPFWAKWRIGISADHRRKDQREFLIHDLFGGVAYEVSRSDLIESKHIVDTMVRVIPTEFEASWYGVPEEEDENELVAKEDDKELDFDRLLVEMSDSDARNTAVIQAVKMGLAQGEQVLVMSHRREHCRHLDLLLARENIHAGFLIGGDDYRKAFEVTRTEFEAGRLQVAVGTFQAIGYGIDLPKAAVVVAATPIAGNKFFVNQVRGRICRKSKNKDDSWFYYLWDRKVYGDRHLRNLINWNRKRCVVWTGTGWIDGKEFLKQEKIRHAQAQ